MQHRSFSQNNPGSVLVHSDRKTAAVLLYSIFTEQFKWGKLEGIPHISHCHDRPESAVSLTTFIIFCLQSTRNQKTAKCVTEFFC